MILGFRNEFAIRPELVELPDTESQQGIAATVEKYPPQIADDLNLDRLAKNASDSTKKALRLVSRRATAKIAVGATRHR
jgi:hypothetical protein